MELFERSVKVALQPLRGLRGKVIQALGEVQWDEIENGGEDHKDSTGKDFYACTRQAAFALCCFHAMVRERERGYGNVGFSGSTKTSLWGWDESDLVAGMATLKELAGRNVGLDLIRYCIATTNYSAKIASTEDRTTLCVLFENAFGYGNNSQWAWTRVPSNIKSIHKARDFVT